jgi:hypothetical protein
VLNVLINDSWMGGQVNATANADAVNAKQNPQTAPLPDTTGQKTPANGAPAQQSAGLLNPSLFRRAVRQL